MLFYGVALSEHVIEVHMYELTQLHLEDASWTTTTTISCGKVPSPTQTCPFHVIPMHNLPLRGWKALPFVLQLAKGTFKAWFTPPAILCHMLQFLVKSPPTWTWTTRAGPSAGKSFFIPSLSTACSKDSLSDLMDHLNFPCLQGPVGAPGP